MVARRTAKAGFSRKSFAAVKIRNQATLAGFDGSGEVAERDILAVFIEQLRLAGWLVFHDFDSRLNEGGVPDVIAVKGRCVAFVEVKTANGRLRRKQLLWLKALSASRRVYVAILRPGNYDRTVDEMERAAKAA